MKKTKILAALKAVLPLAREQARLMNINADRAAESDSQSQDEQHDLACAADEAVREAETIFAGVEA